jgi:hypothetical protein
MHMLKNGTFSDPIEIPKKYKTEAPIALLLSVDQHKEPNNLRFFCLLTLYFALDLYLLQGVEFSGQLPWRRSDRR